MRPASTRKVPFQLAVPLYRQDDAFELKPIRVFVDLVYQSKPKVFSAPARMQQPFLHRQAQSVADAMMNGGGGNPPVAAKVKCRNPYADRDARSRSPPLPENGLKRMRKDVQFAARHGGTRRGTAVEPRTALQKLRETR
ncbi:hypothetical protein THAOC_26505, partial [Thalassiosira oceanica]